MPVNAHRVSRTVRRCAWWVALCALLSGAFFFAVVKLCKHPMPLPHVSREHAQTDGSRVELTTRSNLRHPYYVVSAGVRSKWQLESAIASDALLRQHYAGVDLDRLALIRLQQPLSVHVSYRKATKILWTSYTVTLPRNEEMLTDGHNLIRARCGNRVSATLIDPVSSDEPDAEQLDAELPAEAPEGPAPLVNTNVRSPAPAQPILPPQQPTKDGPSLATDPAPSEPENVPATPVTASSSPLIGVPVVTNIHGGNAPTRANPPTAVPEPSALLLLVPALIALVAVLRRR